MAHDETQERTKVIRLEITVAADVDERELLSRTLNVATHRPADKAITLLDAFETAGITVRDVGRVEIGDATPSFASVIRDAERWYADEVADVVMNAVEEMRVQKPADRDGWLTEWLHETIDGHGVIIHTAQARLVLAATDRPDQYEEEYGEAPATVEENAYAAMIADVRERLEAIRDEWDTDSDDDTDDE